MYLANQPSIKIEQKIKHKSTNLGSKIHQLGAQNRSQEASWRRLGRVSGLWWALGKILEPSIIISIMITIIIIIIMYIITIIINGSSV